MSESVSQGHENDRPVLETHDKRTGTRACDLISRREAIDEVVAWLKDRMTDKKNGKPLTDRLKDLPSAQSELAQDLPNACTDAISRQAAIDGFYEMASDVDHLCTVSDYVHFLETMTSAQPEIIHCRDCKWHNREINQCNAQICASMEPDDFCSRAERREDG